MVFVKSWTDGRRTYELRRWIHSGVPCIICVADLDTVISRRRPGEFAYSNLYRNPGGTVSRCPDEFLRLLVRESWISVDELRYI